MFTYNLSLRLHNAMEQWPFYNLPNVQLLGSGPVSLPAMLILHALQMFLQDILALGVKLNSNFPLQETFSNLIYPFSPPASLQFTGRRAPKSS